MAEIIRKFNIFANLYMKKWHHQAVIYSVVGVYCAENEGFKS